MNEDKIRFHTEHVQYSNEDEKEEGLLYLQLWKKFFLKKCTSMKLENETIFDRPKWGNFDGDLSIKIGMSLNEHNEISKDKTDYKNKGKK